MGPGTNPVDMVFVSADRAYVSRNDSVWLLEVDPTTGALTDSIDLSLFADGDGLPENLADCRPKPFGTRQRVRIGIVMREDHDLPSGLENRQEISRAGTCTRAHKPSFTPVAESTPTLALSLPHGDRTPPDTGGRSRPPRRPR